MGVVKSVVVYGLAAWLLTWVRPWRRFWLLGIGLAAWLVFSTKHTLRAVARRRAEGRT